ncbi:MAG: hypothetical protein ACLQBA_27700 [Candidatus Binataceae bacterium]
MRVQKLAITLIAALTLALAAAVYAGDEDTLSGLPMSSYKGITVDPHPFCEGVGFVARKLAKARAAGVPEETAALLEWKDQSDETIRAGNDGMQLTIEAVKRITHMIYNSCGVKCSTKAAYRLAYDDCVNPPKDPERAE